MRFIILAGMALALAPAAMAQSGQAGSHNPAIKDNEVHAVATPAKGHSSFTESQAKGRIAKAGFTGISDLKKTDDGLWQGSAKKRGRPVMVMLDYKGNVTSK